MLKNIIRVSLIVMLTIILVLPSYVLNAKTVSNDGENSYEIFLKQPGENLLPNFHAFVAENGMQDVCHHNYAIVDGSTGTRDCPTWNRGLHCWHHEGYNTQKCTKCGFSYLLITSTATRSHVVETYIKPSGSYGYRCILNDCKYYIS